MGNQWGTYVPCIQNLGNMAHGEPILEGNWAMAPHQQYGEHILAGKIKGNCDWLIHMGNYTGYHSQHNGELWPTLILTYMGNYTGYHGQQNGELWPTSILTSMGNYTGYHFHHNGELWPTSRLTCIGNYTDYHGQHNGEL